ncbi:DegT/DnrJ/EryC1/StrS family aminotransferase [Brenneria tiliae]|uniref:DegT/DnrJ/EryC1/StrS family aminotransferase n=1 Tax=Brenneria tiliae TaxID=2914984 RepID=UPI00201501F2|nr:DegT/DnrJ/EryC1/StrS family aminotransferase [Brenneria tiliae]MCL2897118.1 DegT/DnrJ/EryC1/StrS family aminotransferase [Brenneria tiliae]MCL2904771.1 DegT/DnrJ/EryC1/StrS family aminotransferase [Brenneria tiliae]
MSIPFYDNTREIKTILEQIDGQWDALIDQCQLVNGIQCNLLEKDIQSFTGIKHAITVGNGTDGLIITLMAAGIGKGDEVIVPCYSFFSSVSSIIHVGATPVFVDIEPDSYAINAELIESSISRKTKAILPVHLFCQMADMLKIQKIAKKYKLIILEDSAEAIGMFQDGVHAGGFGLGGVLSFFPTKTLGALGDAGMILTNSDNFAHACRIRGNLGRDQSGVAQCIGFNSRMDEWHAIILRARLTNLQKNIEARKRNADYLTDQLFQIPQVVRTPALKMRGYTANRVDYVYLIEVEKKDALVKHLSKIGIETETYYPIPLHLQPICRKFGYLKGDFPVAERASSRAVALPMYAEMQQSQLEGIVNAIRDFFKG